MTVERPKVINPNDQESASNKSFADAVRRQETGAPANNDIYNRILAAIKLPDSLKLPDNVFAPGKDTKSKEGAEARTTQAAASAVKAPEGKAAQTSTSATIADEAKGNEANVAKGSAKSEKSSEVTASGKKGSDEKPKDIKLTEQRTKSEGKLNLDAPVYARRGTNKEGTVYASDDGKSGYIRGPQQKRGNAFSFKERHFGEKPEENYSATVTQFRNGLVSYDYGNGAKIVMRQNKSGWVDKPGEEKNSRHIVNFDAHHKETSSVDILTDATGKVTQKFSSGAIREINANGLLAYEKAIGKNGVYEERKFDSLGHATDIVQYIPTKSGALERVPIRNGGSADSSNIAQNQKPQRVDQTPQNNIPIQRDNQASGVAQNNSAKPSDTTRARGINLQPRSEQTKEVDPNDNQKPQGDQVAQRAERTNPEPSAEHPQERRDINQDEAEKVATKSIDQHQEYNHDDPQALVNHMKEEHNATFARPGQVLDLYGHKVFTRAPSMIEAQVCASALERFGLADKNTKPIEFVFISGGDLSGLPQGTNGVYQGDQVFLTPDWNIEKSTGQPVKWFQKDTIGSYREEGIDIFQNVSAELMVAHELAHMADMRTNPEGWEKNQRKEELCSRFGFWEDPFGRVGILKNTGNSFFLGTGNGQYQEHDLQGRPMSPYSITRDQANALAAVPFGTIYWPTAIEASADAKTCLYDDEESHVAILERSKIAYERAVLTDQEDIDSVKGTDAQGNSLMMRAFNGQIVAATYENKKAREQAEQNVLVALARRNGAQKLARR